MSMLPAEPEHGSVSGVQPGPESLDVQRRIGFEYDRREVLPTGSGPTVVRLTRDWRGDARLLVDPGLVAARVLGAERGDPRVGLLATTGTLLGGDAIDIRVQVEPGLRLTLVEIAPTVAYDACGQGASWQVRATVGAGATLTLAGQPFVVDPGARVTRGLIAELDDGAVLKVREQFRLGRSPGGGGELTCATRVSRSGRPLFVEDLVLWGRDRVGRSTGAEDRVVDTILVAQAGATPPPMPPDVTPQPLADGEGWRLRRISSMAFGSPLDAVWRGLTDG